MDSDFLFNFIILSSALNAIMVVLKRVKQIKDNKYFNIFKPILPPVLGAIIGPFVFTNPEVIFCLLSGFLAGTLCTTSYEVFEIALKATKNE